MKIYTTYRNIIIKKYEISAIILMIFTLSGCNSTKDLLTHKIEANDIDKIQIILAMGNPEYDAKSKIITEKDEISSLVDIFNKATIGKKIEDDDIVCSDASKWRFILIATFSYKVQ
ncbi:hypothetical protein SH2C18_35200 [Clostridium sediminicola]|uniref:hypothetical protein n=1 Tax=Clostridium sediminicola TaxID=3114879 RepID=UPI0031F1EB2F